MQFMLPEFIVMGTAFIILIADLMMRESRRKIIAPMALLGLAAAAVSLVILVRPAGAPGVALDGRFVVDSAAFWFKLLFIVAAAFTVMVSWDMLDGRARVKVSGIGFRGEYYAVLLFSVCGMMYLVSARDIITLYVSLELATIPLFILTAWRRDNSLSGEAGLKYVILGALASAFMLYGLGLVYGLTGHADLDQIGRVITSMGHKPMLLWFAVVVILAGVGFKLTIVPFHMWAADVYQGAPTPVTAYLSVASKGAGLAFFFQLFFRIFGGVLPDLAWVIAMLAALTMTVGNTVAIVQHNIKRFMAFSAVSQAGYILIGFLGPFNEGVPAMLFYMLVYIFSNLAVFAAIIWYSNETGRENIGDYRGLSRPNPVVALAMMLGLVSLAGVPPFSGFVGKFFLFNVSAKAGYHWLVAVAAVNSTISLYYYLRVVRQMYIEPTFADARKLPISPALLVILAITALGSILLGLMPQFYEAIHAGSVNWLAMVGK